MVYKIENEYLRVEASSLGGCLSSIYDKKENEELLYQKESDSWQGQDIAIFPFIARLKGKTYTHKGKEYSLKNHGLCRYNEFALIENKGDKMSLLFESSEETLKDYPFPFSFTITYRLEGKRLHVSYEIENKGEESMPFGLGAHPAFRVDSKVEDGKLDTSNNKVMLDRPTKLTRIVFDDKGEFVLGKEEYGTRDYLPTDKKTFQDYKTLCVEGEGLHHVRLVRGSGRTLDFLYEKINYLVVWSFPETGSYIALEPWMSLPDFDSCDKEISKKKTLLHLEAKEVYRFSYSLGI
ncbi:MAG: hypothetical protein K6B65_01230 [Bacilli bacterium]|nr:hypothetical protein [Bacilli bacterium]